MVDLFSYVPPPPPEKRLDPRAILSADRSMITLRTHTGTVRRFPAAALQDWIKTYEGMLDMANATGKERERIEGIAATLDVLRKVNL